MKDTTFTFRIRSEDLKVIKSRAKEMNMSVSEYIVTASIKPIVKIEGIKDFTQQLRRIGVNLNQITVLCHQGKIQCVGLENIQSELHDLWRELSELRRTVNGSGNNQVHR